MKNEGFTLVELLAVIIILGILAVMITPKVTNMLNEAEKNTNMTSAQNLVKAAELKASNNDMTGNNTNIKINYQTGENKNYLDYTGEKPTSGQVQIKSNGEVAMAVRFGDYCYLKPYNSNDISTIPYTTETCDDNANVFINYTMPELATTGDGLYESTTEPNRYIYRGSNPNNYIYLKEDGINNTLYRIISYEPDGTIKVVRDDRIVKDGTNAIRWDEGTARQNTNAGYYCTSANGCNVWGNQENTYYHDTALSNLNQEFYYKYYPSNTSTSLENYTNTGSVSQDTSLNTYLNNTWINTLSFKNKIIDHSFNVGGVYITTSYNEKTLQKIKDEEQVYTWNGKIALMTISEYQEASLSNTCSLWSNYYNNPNNYHNDENNQRVNHYGNGEWPCAINNWTYKSGYAQWSLSPSSYFRYSVWYVNSSGYFNYGSASNALGVRPAFYLKSSIKLRGFGTSDSPYELVES